jgi:hypothetical protein
LHGQAYASTGAGGNRVSLSSLGGSW